MHFLRKFPWLVSANRTPERERATAQKSAIGQRDARGREIWVHLGA